MKNSDRVYYSHAMPHYGTKVEEMERAHILRNMPEVEIVDPGSFADNPEKRMGGMEYCLKLVERCNVVVFTRFHGKITSGVGLEVNHAIKKKIPVYELKDGKLKKVTKPVRHLSREETVRLYRVCRRNQLFSSENLAI